MSVTEPRVAFINGIHTTGAGNTDELCSEMEVRGYRVRDVNYPVVRWWQARSKALQRANAMYLLQETEQGDSVVAHSYGAVLVWRAMQMGRRFDTVFLFGPALDADAEFPAEQARRIFVIHNPNDRAVKLGALLWFHDFGLMGVYGYQGRPDQRVMNRKAWQKRRCHWNHSFYFRPRWIGEWADYVAERLDDRFLQSPAVARAWAL